MKRIFFTVVAFLFFAEANAQSYYFRHYQTDEGLSDNIVNCGVQDQKGFMWIGTSNGLNRFDGTNFKAYKYNPSDTGSVGNNTIFSLMVALDGELWVGTDDGLFVYNSANESFKKIKDSRLNRITDIKEDGTRYLWLISDGKIAHLDKISRHLKFYTFRTNEISALCVTPDHHIWIAEINGNLLEYDRDSDKFKDVATYGNATPTHSNEIVKILALNAGQLIIGTKSEGAKIFFLNENRFESIPVKINNKSDLLIKDILLNGQEIWIATEDGIYVYNISSKSTISLKKDFNNPYSLTDNFISFLFKDREKSIWAGTFFSGVNLYSPLNSLFNKYFTSSHSYSLTGDILNNICQDTDRNLWISTADAGLCKLNPQTESFQKIDFTSNRNGLPSNIPSLLLNGKQLWIGTYEHGLYVINTDDNKLLKHFERPQNACGLDSNFIVCLFKSHAQQIYVGTAGGLFKYDARSNTFAPIVVHDYIRSITEDSDGHIWIGTLHNGAIQFDPVNHRSKTFTTDRQNPNSLWANDVNTIFVDSKKNVWFGTAYGLCKLPDKSAVIERFHLYDGAVLNILEDQAGYLWISTRTGLFHLNGNNQKQVQFFTKGNGLPTNEFNSASAYKDKNGVMYFGTCKGLISFNPAKINFSDYQPPVYLTSLKINDLEQVSNQKNSPLEQSIVSTSKIILNHHQSSFSLDFAALTFVAPKTIKYAYKMAGLDDNWVYLNSNRTVYFTDIKPGTYTFLIKTADISGIWTVQKNKLTIVINPPWWASNLAYSIYFIIAALVIYVIIRGYHKRSQEHLAQKLNQFENEKQHEIYNAKIEFFTHITHEIKTPLTLINGPLENIMKTAKRDSTMFSDLSLIEKNTRRLVNLTNQLLDFKKIGTGHFNLIFTRISISDLLTEIRSDFEPLLKTKNYQVTLNLPSYDLWAEVDADSLRKIISNLFTNAIKYADKNISFELYSDEENFFLKEANDGLPIPKELSEKIFEPFFRLQQTNHEQGSGIGLPLSRSLAELHNGTLVAIRENTQLNVFLLKLPLHQNRAIIISEEEFLPNNEAIEQSAGRSKITILIVDDNVEITAFLKQSLVKHYIVHIAKNGREAIEILKTKPVELIVSDVMMPIMDGIEFCDHVKNDLEFSHIPFILLTAKNTLQSKIEGLESGADVYIEKPFSPDHLLSQIKSLIKNREMVKTHFATSPIVNIKDIAYSKSDEKFVEKLNIMILGNISDPGLDVHWLADKLNMSRATLYRKINAISNLSPNELINLARLKKAAELLAEDQYKIFEISSMVGFNSQTYFGHAFLKQFKVTPTEYAQSTRKGKMPIIS